MARNLSNSTPEVVSKASGPLGVFGSGRVQFFSAPGTYTFTTPAGVKAIKVRVWGAGGSGALGLNTTSAGGGAGGGYSEKTILNPSGSYTVTVGEGGGARNYSQLNGIAGGTSSFGSECSATGGAGGYTNGTNAYGGAGSGGDINYTAATNAFPGGTQVAGGGGSAAGPWGTGHAIPSTSWRGNSYVALGGAGIGGPPSKNTTANTWQATGGGGAFGAGGNMAGGPDANGNTYPVYESTTTSDNVASSPTQVSSGLALRFPGEWLGGIGGQAFLMTHTPGNTYFAGNGGPGGGGGACAPYASVNPAVRGGNGGPFGGGGATVSGSTNQKAGNGGTAAGGGAASTPSNVNLLSWSGGGGDGLVVVEW